MSSTDIDKIFDMKQRIFLGGQISHKHQEFKMLASLGYDEAEQYQFLQFWKYLSNQKNVQLEDILESAIVMLGRAKMLRQTKELTRLSMVMGDTRKVKKYGSRRNPNPNIQTRE